MCSVSRKVVGPTSLTFPLGLAFPQNMSHKKHKIQQESYISINFYLIKLLSNSLKFLLSNERIKENNFHFPLLRFNVILSGLVFYFSCTSFLTNEWSLGVARTGTRKVALSSNHLLLHCYMARPLEYE